MPDDSTLQAEIFAMLMGEAGAIVPKVQVAAPSGLVRTLEMNWRAEDPAWMSQPFMVDVGRERWSVATDRAQLVAVKEAGYPMPDVEGDPLGKERLDHVRRLVRCAPPDSSPRRRVTWLSVLVEHLLDWANLASETIPYGVIEGVLVDRYRLCNVLGQIPFKSVAVWDASEPAGMPALGLFSGGGRWRAIVAGILPYDSAESYPSFEGGSTDSPSC